MFCCSKNRCAELSKELTDQKEEFCHRVSRVKAELQSESGALLQRLEETDRERDGEEMLCDFNFERNTCFLTLCVFMCVFVTGLLQLVSEKDKVIDKGLRQTETLRRGMIIESHHHFCTSCLILCDSFGLHLTKNVCGFGSFFF